MVFIFRAKLFLLRNDRPEARLHSIPAQNKRAIIILFVFLIEMASFISYEKYSHIGGSSQFRQGETLFTETI